MQSKNWKNIWTQFFLENSNFTLSSLTFPNIQFPWGKTLFHTCLLPFLPNLSKNLGPNYAFLQNLFG
jgi:hypothetical protein